MLELVEPLASWASATSFEPELAAARTGEVERMCARRRRGRAELGWNAKIGLAEGLR